MITLAQLAAAEPRLLAASIEGILVLLAIYLISAAANWFKRRSAEKEADNLPLPTPPPLRRSPDPRPTPAGPTNWEEELRRLLEGEVPLPQPTAPPPVIVTPPPVLTPASPPCALDPRSESSEAPSRPLATLAESERAHRRAEERLRKAQALTSAGHAHQQASTLHTRVAERMRQAGQHIHTTTPDAYNASAQLRPRSVDLQLLQNPATARQAIISAIVLGPPKSLEA